MTALLYALVLWLWENRSLDTISRSNAAKIEAQQAYQRGDYREAVVGYEHVLEASLFAEPEARLNLAHSYFKTNRLMRAENYYLRLAKVPNPILAARAFTQLGVIKAMRKDTVKALQYLKQALVKNEDNQVARYNFELLKKQFTGKLTAPKATSRESASKTQPPSRSLLPEQQRQVLQTEQKKELLDKLRDLKMSEAQALQLLDAMKASEIQYLQQRKKTITGDNSRGSW